MVLQNPPIIYTHSVYSERVFGALVIQHAMSMRRIGLSSVAFKAVQNICTLSHKRQNIKN